MSVAALVKEVHWVLLDPPGLLGLLENVEKEVQQVRLVCQAPEVREDNQDNQESREKGGSQDLQDPWVHVDLLVKLDPEESKACLEKVDCQGRLGDLERQVNVDLLDQPELLESQEREANQEPREREDVLDNQEREERGDSLGNQVCVHMNTKTLLLKKDMIKFVHGLRAW